jgi:hypothetical protein
MKTAKHNLAPAVALLLALCLTAPALGNSEFLFNGNAKYWDGETPDAVGSTMEVYGILSSVWQVPPPIALDTVNYEYTVYIATMYLSSYTYMPMPFPMKAFSFDYGEIHIFADPIVGGTAADNADPTTFMDGELILLATVDPAWAMNLNDIDGDGAFVGSGAGSCDFVGGTQLDALAAAEYYLDDWQFYGSPVSDPSAGTIVPPNFHRLFDVKIATTHDPTPAVESSWGRVKNLYR